MDMFNIEKSVVEITCPKCNYQNKTSLEDVAKEKTIVCGGCREEIKLTDSEKSTKKAIKNINSSIENLNKTIKDFSK